MPSQNVNNSFHDTDIDQVQSEIKLKDFCNTDEEKVDISEFEVNDSSQVDCNDPLYAPSTGADANSSLDDEEDIKIEHSTKEKLDKLLKERVSQRKDEIDNRKKYVCTFDGCSMKFPRPSRLAIHQRTHTGERPFKCSHCEKSYVRKQHLQAHVARNHKSKPIASYSCDLCDQQFLSKDNVSRHKKRAHDSERFKCSECDAAFPKRQDRQKHISLEHVKTKKEGDFPCDFCDKLFWSKEELMKHKSSHKEHTCKSCDLTFVQWTLYQQHRKEHRKEYKKTICPTCGIFVKTSALPEHRKTHEEERNVIHCPLEECQKFFYHYRNMKKHFRVKHCKEKFVCSYSGCCEEFLHSKSLKEHVKRDHENVAEKVLKSKKKPCVRKDKGTFKKPLAAIFTRIEVEPGSEQALLSQKQKLPLDNLEKIRNEAKQFVGSCVETSDSESGTFVGCGRAFVDMSKIKKSTNKKRRQALENKISSKVTKILEGKANLQSIFHDISSDTDTDVDTIRYTPNNASSQPRKIDFLKFVNKKLDKS